MSTMSWWYCDTFLSVADINNHSNNIWWWLFHQRIRTSSYDNQLHLFISQQWHQPFNRSRSSLQSHTTYNPMTGPRTISSKKLPLNKLRSSKGGARRNRNLDWSILSPGVFERPQFAPAPQAIQNRLRQNRLTLAKIRRHLSAKLKRDDSN